MDYTTLTNLGFEFQDGQENPSGMQEEAFLLAIGDLATEGKPVPALTAESVVTIATDHVLKAAKAVIPVNLLGPKSGLMTKLSGEELSKIFETDVEFFMPQINAKHLGGAAAIKNTRFMVLIRRVGQSNGFWQIGCKAMPAKVQDIAGGFGVGYSAEVGLKVTLKAFDVVPMYDYQGDLPVPAP